MTDLMTVKSLSEWPQLRAEIERTVRGVLGAMPKERPELQAKTVDEMEFEGYIRKRVNYFVDDWERVSAWVFVPAGKEEAPALLCCHQMVGQGKDEPAGLDGNPLLAFAQHYAQLGYVTFAPDCITAGDRVSVDSAPYDTKSFYKDNPRSSAMGKMLWDHVRAVDALCESKRVDAARVGVIGHGLGGHNALLLAALDERIQVCVASCGFTRFADDKTPERWALHSGFVYMPRLKKAIKEGAFPFDWEHVLALAAPTPTLVIAALNDDRFSNAGSCEKAVNMARAVYELLGARDALGILCHQHGHDMDLASREVADEWFERWL
ncbi:MAG TPA: prolyl oligopeptidase family serine peptidase [Candidatus Hydrogenedentes bacterium]|nr:prolyl oligopeptidase family serine peptidase [Candidatus Hydrogenedentota bacterium]HIJ73427.1 prolyl oligopeptidase family serine peptidase [Candidatus Hydrogenedentota bacterium]